MSVAVGLFFDGRNCYQVDIGGSRMTAVENFKSEMISRGAVWGRLFLVANGELLSSYNQRDVEIDFSHIIARTNGNVIELVCGHSRFESLLPLLGKVEVLCDGKLMYVTRDQSGKIIELSSPV